MVFGLSFSYQFNSIEVYDGSPEFVLHHLASDKNNAFIIDKINRQLQKTR